MRGLAMAATGLALVLAGCVAPASRPPKAEAGKAGYNRREMPPTPGLFTDEDGSWTIYRNDADRARPAAGPKRRTVLSCEPGHECASGDDEGDEGNAER